MSGSSDYTTTPNLALFKPISNRAIGTWGDLWNSNADTLDGAMANLSGGPFLPLTGGSVSGPITLPGNATTALQAIPLQQLTAAVTVSVKTYGAVGNGTTNDTTAIQAASNAIPASGGILLFPPGVYLVTSQITVPSNTIVQGQGATLLGSFAVAQAILTNRNFAATTLTDHDITVRDLTLDYGSSPPNGGSHAIHFMMVRNVCVTNCTFQCRGAGDGVSLPGSYNAIIEGCTAYGFTNSAYDFWWGCSNGRVIGCYAETAASAQMVAWNPENTAEQSNALSSYSFMLANCTLVCTGPNAIPSQLEPLVGGNYAGNIAVLGNTFYNSYLVMRGATSNAVVANNVFDSVAGGVGVIVVVPRNGGTPANFTITGNTIVNPATTAANTAVINAPISGALIANNAIFGGVAGVTGIDTGSATPTVHGNYISNGIINSTLSTAQTDTLRLGRGLKFGSQTATGPGDFSKHIDLYGGQAGINVQGGGLTTYTTPSGGAHEFYTGATQLGYINGGGLTLSGAVTVGGVGNFGGGINFDNIVAGTPTDLSKHITLIGGFGLSASSGQLNLVVPAGQGIVHYIGGAVVGEQFPNGFWSVGLQSQGGLGVFGAAILASKPTLTGAKGGNTALASVIAALVAYGMATDSTT